MIQPGIFFQVQSTFIFLQVQPESLAVLSRRLSGLNLEKCTFGAIVAVPPPPIPMLVMTCPWLVITGPCPCCPMMGPPVLWGCCLGWPWGPGAQWFQMTKIRRIFWNFWAAILLANIKIQITLIPKMGFLSFFGVRTVLKSVLTFTCWRWKFWFFIFYIVKYQWKVSKRWYFQTKERLRAGFE